MIMKKKILLLTLALVIGSTGLTGCTEEKKAGKSTTEEVDSYTDEMKDTLGGQISAPSEAVTKAVSNTWTVQGEDDIYELKSDGTGKKNEEDLTFECGFDDEKNITLQMKIGDAEMLYAISTDETGYGIRLTSLDGGEDLYFLPADLEFLDMADERAEGILGEWSDESGNTYKFDEDKNMEITGESGTTEGTYSVVENAEGTLLLRIVVSGGSLEYEYTLNEDDTQMNLVSPGTDTVHRWTKIK